ncbi:MAG TPA: efflux RND transporter periplasmic adaptor subunit [Saprospiraceae bacterium]|nr:efflux RND transporter periplasmic adaptor subunit [Saprospiraceae bacterium]
MVLILAASGCTHSHSHEDGHSHEDDHFHNSSGGHGPEALQFTHYTDKTELFIEFEPLVSGKERMGIAHFTILGERFKPVTEGKLRVQSTGTGAIAEVQMDQPDKTGIYKVKMQAQRSGMTDLQFILQTSQYSDTIRLDSMMVYESDSAAIAAAIPSVEDSRNISYLKEQAWNVDFATQPASVQLFSESLRTSGQLISSPEDESLVTAQISGIISFQGEALSPGMSVAVGKALFTIRSNEVVRSEIQSEYEKAEDDLKTAKQHYDRAQALIQDRIISQKEFLDARLRYEQAKTQLDRYRTAQQFSKNQATVRSASAGYIRDVLVENGQFVSAGQTLATLSKNKKLVLHADVSQKYFSKIALIRSANFKAAGDDRVYSTTQLNGKLKSFGRTVETKAPFIPILFELENTAGLIPGSAVEVYLLAAATPALVIPEQALIEEQGIFYVYVQLAGEQFQKREVKIGSGDGKLVKILSGLDAGERVVTLGAYHIKLSTAGGALPAHGHEH